MRGQKRSFEQAVGDATSVAGGPASGSLDVDELHSGCRRLKQFSSMAIVLTTPEGRRWYVRVTYAWTCVLMGRHAWGVTCTSVHGVPAEGLASAGTVCAARTGRRPMDTALVALLALNMMRQALLALRSPHVFVV